jgi:CDGSH-type Zn-finger protein
LPNVFNTKKRPWVDINGAAPEEIIKLIDTCPSGALRYSLPAGSKVRPCLANGSGSIDYIDKSMVTTMKAMKKGPLLVEGRTALYDIKGELIKEANRMTLCQCGFSSNMPFCDGSHRPDVRSKKAEDAAKTE